MSILNRGWIYDSITRNQDSGSVSYRWTLKAQICVCLGSGGGYVPRLMIDATWELGETNMYPENEYGEVYVVDATNSVNGEVDWADDDSYLRSHFKVKFLNMTTEDAFYNFFVKRDIKIDYLHIDADHTYEGCKLDFDLYSTIMNENGIISIHDTDEKYMDSFATYEDESHDLCMGPSKFIKEISNKWEIFNLFDYKEKSEKLPSSGLTLLRRKNEV